MKSLEDHNKEAFDFHKHFQTLNEPHPNGIGCPKCGKELWDTSPAMTLTSYPAQKNVHCLYCGYVGYRLA